MDKPTNHVCIGIQARSTSTRFPGKVFELIGGKEMLRHVRDAAENCAFNLNRRSHSTGIRVTYAILCPEGDPIRDRYEGSSLVILGSETDVLSRYVDYAKRLNADYVVRITGDCPMLPGHLIAKHITTAVANSYDYCSNVDAFVRTSIDGHDVEVFSRRALAWADENAKTDSLREHVTQVMRTPEFRESFRSGSVQGFVDLSHVKFSVDTPDDLERVRVEYSRVQEKLKRAFSFFGKSNAHRY